ncbi:MAG: cyclic nucleotide-binding domain-containing protein [Xanthobacteraceae bacterium]
MLHSSELMRPFQVVNSHWDSSGENSENKIYRAMPLNSEEPTSQNSIAALPLVTYQAGETVIAYGSSTARVLILKKGTVAIIKENTEIAKVTEPGAVFGELSVLLDQPNKVDVRALETSQFHVADAAVLLTLNPIAAHVAMVLARQLDNANDLQMNRALPWIS